MKQTLVLIVGGEKKGLLRGYDVLKALVHYWFW